MHEKVTFDWGPASTYSVRGGVLQGPHLEGRGRRRTRWIRTRFSGPSPISAPLPFLDQFLTS